MGSQIEIKWMFSLVKVFDNFKALSLASGEHGSNYHCDEKLVWSHVLQLQAKFKLEAILKSKNMFDKKNYDLIEEHNFLEKLQINDY